MLRPGRTIRFSPNIGPSTSRAAELDLQLADRQALAADGRARGLAAVAVELHQEVGGAIDHARLIGEGRRRVDEAEHLDGLLHAIEIAEGVLDHAERVRFDAPDRAAEVARLVAEQPFDREGEPDVGREGAQVVHPVGVRDELNRRDFLKAAAIAAGPGRGGQPLRSVAGSSSDQADRR